MVQNVHPCHEELPPWFLERQNISRRHPGHGHSGKLPCLFFFSFDMFRVFNLTDATFNYLFVHVQNDIPTTQISSLALAFHAVRSLVGVDLLSLDGRLAVRCSNTTLPYQEVKRFIRVARWVYKATGCKCACSTQTIEFGASSFHICNLHLRDNSTIRRHFLVCLRFWCQAANCTLVTSSLRLVDKRSRSWPQRSSAQLRGVTRTRMKRRGFAKKDGLAAVFRCI